MTSDFIEPPTDITVPAGTRLYAFTDGGPNRRWWATVEPIVEDDPGLDGHIAKVAAESVGMLNYVRDRFAADDDRDALGLPQLGMARCLLATLMKTADAEVGLVSPPPRRYRPVNVEIMPAIQLFFETPPEVRAGPIQLLP